jgi:DNA polymerase-3 subunit alpha
MAATMSSDMDNTDTVKIFFEDTIANGVKVLPPDVNASFYRFEPTDAKTIRYGLGGVKGVGAPAVEAILAARAEGPFKDLFDFCTRVDRRAVNRRVVEALIRAGAFDTLDSHRARLIASVGVAMEWAEHQAANAAQAGLFDEPDMAAQHSPSLVEAKPWTERQQLTEEKTAIGFFLSGHPYNSFKHEVARFIRTPLARLEPRREPQVIAGVVAGMRVKIGQRGKMCFVQLDDGTAQFEVSVFAETLDANKNKIVTDEVLIVEAKISHDDFTGGLRIVADKLMTLGEARARYARSLVLRMNGEVEATGGARAAASRLQDMLAAYRGDADSGGCPVRLSYRNGRAQGDLPFGGSWRVRLEEPLLEQLRDWLSAESVEILYQ